jgi:hypothetical protein
MSTSRTPARAFVLLLASLAGQALALSAVVAMAGALVFSLASGDMDNATFAAWSAASSFGVMLALLPGAYWGWQRASGRAEPPPSFHARAWRAAWLLVPIGLLAGGLAFHQGGPGLTLTLAPAMHVVTSLSVAVVLILVIQRRGPPVSSRKVATSFTIGLTAVPLMAVVAELAVLLPIVVIGGAWLVSSPEGISLVQSFMASGGDPAAFDSSLLTELMRRPAVVATVFGFTAGIVPWIEELAKTAAVWPSLRRGLPAAQAFLTGAVAGAGYGLFEALFLSQPGPDWLGTALGRLGASFMHAATAGLTSWGLMEWARERRWDRALASYFLSVLAHAVWNTAALSSGYDQLLRTPEGGGAPSTVGLIAVLVLIALSLTAGLGIAFRRRADEQAAGTPPPGP